MSPLDEMRVRLNANICAYACCCLRYRTTIMYICLQFSFIFNSSDPHVPFSFSKFEILIVFILTWLNPLHLLLSFRFVSFRLSLSFLSKRIIDSIPKINGLCIIIKNVTNSNKRILFWKVFLCFNVEHDSAEKASLATAETKRRECTYGKDHSETKGCF